MGDGGRCQVGWRGGEVGQGGEVARCVRSRGCYNPAVRASTLRGADLSNDDFMLLA
jgi:hypothetical protein